MSWNVTTKEDGTIAVSAELTPKELDIMSERQAFDFKNAMALLSAAHLSDSEFESSSATGLTGDAMVLRINVTQVHASVEHILRGRG
jgi:hypothetical protein